MLATCTCCSIHFIHPPPTHTHTLAYQPTRTQICLPFWGVQLWRSGRGSSSGGSPKRKSQVEQSKFRSELAAAAAFSCRAPRSILQSYGIPSKLHTHTHTHTDTDAGLCIKVCYIGTKTNSKTATWGTSAMRACMCVCVRLYVCLYVCACVCVAYPVTRWAMTMLMKHAKAKATMPGLHSIGLSGTTGERSAKGTTPRSSSRHESHA